MASGTYPQNPEEWQSAIQYGIGVGVTEGQESYEVGEFPYDELVSWIRETYSEGFSPDFVPALLRNIKGLVAWVYADSSEPCWPGSDSDSEDQAPG
jgi:hypothetical protein